MCGLCQLRGAFGDPIADHDPLEAIKSRAKRLKKLIALHEKTAAKHPCEVSAARLEALKAEQYELARKL